MPSFPSPLKSLLVRLALPGWVAMTNPLFAATEPPPNVVLIYADDLGYGDVGCYGATGVSTPNIDRLAREGLRFTDAYASSATCTPSRYSLLTGEYAFRHDNVRILPGDASLLIDPERVTMGDVFQQAGYTTGIVGKWHLGLGRSGEPVEWNGEIGPGPNDVGFDYAFNMAATGDRVACVYIENRHVVGLDPSDPVAVDYATNFPGEPTGISERDHLKLNWSQINHAGSIVNGISRIGYMQGGLAARWVDEDMADTFTGKAVEFIERNQAQPFFLYFATHDIHVPRVPHPRFVGLSDMGPRGDAIAQLDACVGEILATLDRLGLTENTLVLLSSDNGPILDDGYQDDAVEKLGEHRPAGPYRSGKYSIYEGGTRVPFIVRWPGRVPPGDSTALVSQVDLLASFAQLIGQANPSEARDSHNVLPALLGETSTSGRVGLVEHDVMLAWRAGDWKYIEPTAKEDRWPTLDRGISPEPQLYNLRNDPGERDNIAAQYPDRASRMAAELNAIK